MLDPWIGMHMADIHSAQPAQPKGPEPEPELEPFYTVPAEGSTSAGGAPLAVTQTAEARIIVHLQKNGVSDDNLRFLDANGLLGLIAGIASMEDVEVRVKLMAL
jgi:hypothetical protein